MAKTNYQEYIIDKDMKVISIKLLLKDYKKLVLLAKSNERTLAGQVRFMIKEGL